MPSDYLKKQPTKAEQAIAHIAEHVDQSINNLSMQIIALARAAKLTPEEFVKAMRESGANHAFLLNCQLEEKRLELEEQDKEKLKVETTEEAKEAIDQLAIK